MAVENGKICMIYLYHLGITGSLLITHDLLTFRTLKDHGSCHCGAVKVSLKVKPLETYDIAVDEERIIECNCSICMRVSSPV